MSEFESPAPPDASLETLATRARNGDRTALEALVRAIQPDVHRLALRFLWHPEDAEDATQEILVRVITRLDTFRGESAFRTWVYRVAFNALLTIRKGRMERRTMTFREFGDDLARGLSDEPIAATVDVDEALLLEEVRIGCTLAMLLCLDREHRAAYILGEILELEHKEASHALEVSPATYRKRLSRARADILAVMRSRCGLFAPANSCRCRRRVHTAIQLGRVDPSHLLFARSREQARRFPAVLHEIRRLEEARRAAALHRSHALPGSSEFGTWLRGVLGPTGDA